MFAAPENQLFLIGDPKQAIYGFRGADIFTYLKASQQADHVYTLKENWRSESGLVRSVNTVFGASARPFVFEGIRFQPVEAKGEADKKPLTVDGRQAAGLPALVLATDRRRSINKGAAKEQLPSLVAAEIVRLLNGNATLGDRKLLPEDIAVLVPENRQAQLVQDALGAAQRSRACSTPAPACSSPGKWWRRSACWRRSPTRRANRNCWPRWRPT